MGVVKNRTKVGYGGPSFHRGENAMVGGFLGFRYDGWRESDKPETLADRLTVRNFNVEPELKRKRWTLSV